MPRKHSCGSWVGKRSRVLLTTGTSRVDWKQVSAPRKCVLRLRSATPEERQEMHEHNAIRGLAGAAVAPELATSTPTAGTVSAAKYRGWIESRAYDLALFTLSPLAGLLIVALQRMTKLGSVAGVMAVYFVGIPHYLSTFTFYLGDQNRDHYRLRWAAFFAGPLIIFGSVLTLRVLDVAGIVQSIIFTWNIYHVSLQSAQRQNRTEDNRSEEHTSELQSHLNIVCRLLLEKKKNRY